ncbi:TetR family transcriptional regulator [Nocardioides sp. QY071]|uniref:TetR/AcrR family transcriptional regulator n=1 Tax=Nocardioides sp. QY071 TaxID=3044187 RepID=UPI002499D712|nr:TetR family transcriptional regulator [Nocardioides sp. QY071]WGY02860.1 TetR family transcriptional regulator [Nocardioides sp. QY071]
MAHIPTEVRRQQFIDAAIEVIARDGVDGATTRKIAQEAGAPLATLHYCFQTKENLLWAVFEYLADTIRTELEERVPQGQSTASIAEQVLTETLRAAIDRPSANRAQLEIWLWAERNDQEVALRLYDMYVEVWREQLKAAKAPLPDDEIESLARVVLALVDGLNNQLIAHGDEKLLRREIDTATAMLAAYLGRRRRRSA